MRLLLTLLGGEPGWSDPALAERREFSAQVADTLRRTLPALKVEILDELELKLTTEAGGESTAFLQNAYDALKQSPAHRAEIIAKFVAGVVESFSALNRRTERSRIVPLVKDRKWLDEARDGLQHRGKPTPPEFIYDEFDEELVVLYAEDLPNNVRYLVPDDLEHVQVRREGLRALACANLQRILPRIQFHQTSGVYLIGAGGTFEASLLLLDSVWEDPELCGPGELIVSIPTRDMLLAIRSQSAEDVEKMKFIAGMAYRTGTYRLTPRLFIRRHGRFESLPD
jgi:uncharacterized protein YtpQ (UPF0354 family)